MTCNYCEARTKGKTGIVALEREVRKEIARKMWDQEVSIDDIMILTNLTLEEINGLGNFKRCIYCEVWEILKRDERARIYYAEREVKRKVIKFLIIRNLPIDQIVLCTRLSREEIEEIIKE